MKRNLGFGTLVFTAALALFACSGEGTGGEGIPAHCNPLGGPACQYPWPSSAYLAEADTATGYRIEVPREAMPINIDNRAVDPEPFARYDGFAPSGTILAAFEGGVSAEGLPPKEDPSQSLAADSPVVLLNMETGERVSFFAEVDMNADDPAQRTLIIRPLERMAPGTRHAVGIRTSVRGPDGSPVIAPAAFTALLAGEEFDHPMMDKLAPRYPEIFAALEDAGVARTELALAWDFVTASDEMLTRDLLTMRDASLPAIGENGANLTFEAEVVGEDDRAMRYIVGTHDAPNFLTDGELDTSIIQRDAAGLPVLDGTYEANFAAIVPRCAETAELPLPVIVFGHGLFGSAADYLDGGTVARIAQQECYVIVGGDFIGLTGRQFAAAAFTANDFSRADGITEKLAQAVINFIALEQITRGPFHDHELFQVGGQPVIDPSRVYYLGASLGGIMGNVLLAYDPNLERGVLGVPGGAWSLLIERSFAWTPLQSAVLGAYESPYDYQLLISLLGMRFEPYDPITTAANVTGVADPLPGVPVKQVLLYEAVGDSLVTNLATEMVAREMGLDVCGPSLRVPWRMAEHLEPAPSALTIYDERVTPKPPDTNVPPAEDNGTHSDINDRPAVIRQMRGLFENGVVQNECRLEGEAVACDCTTGACD